MNQISIIARVLNAIAENPSSFVFPGKTPELFESEIVAAIDTINGRNVVVFLGFRSQVLTNLANWEGHANKIQLVALARFLMPRILTGENLLALLNNHSIDLCQISSLFANHTMKIKLIEAQIQLKLNTDKTKQPVPKHSAPQLQIHDVLAQLNAGQNNSCRDVFHNHTSQTFSDLQDQEEEVKKRKAPIADTPNKEPVPVNWDKPIFNGFNQVKYNRRESDVENGYRQIKVVVDGHVMSYPVDAVAGEPLFSGLDPKLYSVFNLEDESDDLLNVNEMNSLVASKILNEMFPDKAEQIEQMMTKLAFS